MKKSLVLVLVLALTLCSAVCAETSPFCKLNPSAFDSVSFILTEAETGTVVIEEKADEHLPMESITKLMVLLIADEYIEEGKLSLDEIVTGTATAKATEGSRVYLDEGEEMTLDDILKSISIPSANDAAVALAEHISGSEEAFVKLMNERAEKLGLKNTHYVNASGLDTDGHYSTARDISVLAREIMLKHPRIMQHAATVSDTVRNGSFPLTNTNNLLSNYEYATGLKTGTTDGAGYCLAATAEKNGTKLIAVLLGAPTSADRFNEAKYLFEYAFSDFSLIKVQGKGALSDDEGNPVYAEVKRGNKLTVPLNAKKDVFVYIPSSHSGEIKTELEIDENLTAPIPEGTVVGKIKYTIGDTVVASADAVTAVKIKKMNIFQAFWHVLRAWFSL